MTIDQASDIVENESDGLVGSEEGTEMIGVVEGTITIDESGGADIDNIEDDERIGSNTGFLDKSALINSTHTNLTGHRVSESNLTGVNKSDAVTTDSDILTESTTILLSGTGDVTTTSPETYVSTQHEDYISKGGLDDTGTEVTMTNTGGTTDSETNSGEYRTVTEVPTALTFTLEDAGTTTAWDLDPRTTADGTMTADKTDYGTVTTGPVTTGAGVSTGTVTSPVRTVTMGTTSSSRGSTTFRTSSSTSFPSSPTSSPTTSPTSSSRTSSASTTLVSSSTERSQPPTMSDKGTDLTTDMEMVTESTTILLSGTDEVKGTPSGPVETTESGVVTQDRDIIEANVVSGSTNPLPEITGNILQINKASICKDLDPDFCEPYGHLHCWNQEVREMCSKSCFIC